VYKNTPKLSYPFCSSPGIIERPKIITEILPDAMRVVEHGFDDRSEVEGNEENKINAIRNTRDAIRDWILIINKLEQYKHSYI
jgi:hypothetical protein